MGQDHSGWTDERVELLKKLWQEGLSASQIARQIGGITRMAVIGKARRLKLPEHSFTTKKLNARLLAPRGDRVKGIAAPRTPKPRPDNLAAVNAERRAAAQDPDLTLPTSTPLAGSVPRPWPTRAFDECCWPVGNGEGPDLLSCCNPVHAKGWCAAHFARGTQKPKPGQPRTGNELARSLRRCAA